MNYPIDSIAIIAPILFIVLLAGFFIIGLFGGWKRAAFWGGGNLLFYVIGMIIWKFAGMAIISPIAPLITKLIGSLEGADFNKVVYSIVAPVFFLIVFLIANLILLINYYAWYKKKVGLKKTKYLLQKQEDGSFVKVPVQPENNQSGGSKAINMIVGCVLMPALMLPTTFGLTQATFFATTSLRTRQNNSFANSFYNGIQGFASNFTWFSYYDNYGSVAKDFDAIFGLLNMKTNNISLTLADDTEYDGAALDGFSELLQKGYGMLYFVVNADEQQIKGMYNDWTHGFIVQCNKMVDDWNTMVESYGIDMRALFDSVNATEMLKQILNVSGEPEIVPASNIPHYDGDQSIFAKAFSQYNTGSYTYTDDQGVEHTVEATAASKMQVTQENFDNFADALYSCYAFADDVTEPQKEIFKGRMYQLTGLLLSV